MTGTASSAPARDDPYPIRVSKGLTSCARACDRGDPRLPGRVSPQACWRRTVAGLDRSQHGGYAVLGEQLTAGERARLPVGTLVFGVDRRDTGLGSVSRTRRHRPDEDATVTVLLVSEQGLAQVWQRHFATAPSAVGATTLKRLRRCSPSTRRPAAPYRYGSPTRTAAGAVGAASTYRPVPATRARTVRCAWCAGEPWWRAMPAGSCGNHAPRGCGRPDTPRICSAPPVRNVPGRTDEAVRIGVVGDVVQQGVETQGDRVSEVDSPCFFHGGQRFFGLP